VALQLYNRKYWFPTGTPSANVPARVFLYDDNVFADLFADQAGTIPISNPGHATDGAGFLTFWAEEGQYWVHIDAETFLIDVGLSEEQADLSTGIASGGELSVNGGNPQAVDISPLVGYVVDNNALTSIEPTIVKVDEPAQTVVIAGLPTPATITFWLMDSAGTVIQQAFPPTPTQRRTHIALGATLYDTGSASIVEVQTQPVVLGQPVGQLADLMDGVGPFSVGFPGNLLSPLPASLSFAKTAGSLFVRGLNHFAAGVLTDSPHYVASPSMSPAVFRRIIRTPEDPLPPANTTVDPANYDFNGVLTPVGGGVNTTTVQRVYAVGTDNDPNRIAVQYGQATYGSLAAAVSAIGAEPFVPSPVIGFGALIGYIAMIRTATNLSDPAQATFVRAGKFPTP
jgi:hypothetical protein